MIAQALLAGAVVGLGLYALIRVYLRPRPGIAAFPLPHSQPLTSARGRSAAAPLCRRSLPTAHLRPHK